MEFKELKKKVLRLPVKPGVYMMRDKTSAIIYIGKAKALKSRVTSYFLPNIESEKTRRMVANIDDFDVIVTESEFEALVLENALIKRYQPKYNILLKDGKGYPYIRLDRNEAYPNFELASARADDRALYFGPYGGRAAARAAVETIKEAIRLPVCSKVFPRDIGKGRPCLQYHMGRCAAPCAGNISQDEYLALIDEAVELLGGRFEEIAVGLRGQMERKSESLEFEAAAALRDRIKALDKLRNRQNILTGTTDNIDIIGFSAVDAKGCIVLFHILDGQLAMKESTFVDVDASEEAAAVSEFIRAFYTGREDIPRAIITRCPVEDSELLEELFRSSAGRVVKLKLGTRGSRRRLLELAEGNAREEILRLTTRQERNAKFLTDLKDMLGLAELPERIEAYDISNLGDSDIVGGMIVFEKDGFKKKAYRRFKIKGKQTADDYYAMSEMLMRRFSKERVEDKKFSESLPGLLLIDGGQGHAGVAERALALSGLNIPVFGMKKDDKHRTKSLVDKAGNEIILSLRPAVFAFVGRIQEEVHRFSVEYQRTLRGKRGYASELDNIPGIGPERKKALLTAFGGIRAVKAAGLQELREKSRLPEGVCRDVYARFHQEEDKT